MSSCSSDITEGTSSKEKKREGQINVRHKCTYCYILNGVVRQEDVSSLYTDVVSNSRTSLQMYTRGQSSICLLGGKVSRMQHPGLEIVNEEMRRGTTGLGGTT